MAQKQEVLITLPEGKFSVNFIRALAMALHLKLVTDTELTFWFDNGKTKDFITQTLFNRVIENRKNR